MRMRHSTGSKQLVIRSKSLSPPRSTWKEFTSSKLATTRVSKGKSSKKSIPGIGKPSPSTMKKTQAPPKETHVPIGESQEQPSTDIPTVPVLWSPPPFGPCEWQTLPAQLINTSLADTSNLDSVSGTNMISSDATDIACNALISVPKMRAATPKPPLWPGSALDKGLSWSVPSMHPLSRAATLLDAAVTNTSVLSGHLALLRQMSWPRWLESATASPDLLLTQSGQNLGFQPQPTNQDSQVSDSSQIHGITLK